jgi:general secretion pathway protein E
VTQEDTTGDKASRESATRDGPPRVIDLLDTLRARGHLSADEVERLRRRARSSGERVETLLARLGTIGESDLADALSTVLDVPRIAAAAFPAAPVAAGGASLGFLRRARILPLEETAERLVVASADPTDTQSLRALELFAGRPVTLRIALPSDIDRALERLHAPERDGNAPRPSHQVTRDASANEDDDSAATSLDAPAIRAVEDLVSRAVSARASDLHLESTATGLRVRYRIDGDLMEMGDAPEPYLAAMIISRVKILAGLNIAEKRLPQDGRASLGVHGRRIDLRVSTAPTIDGESVVLRLLDASAAPRSLAALGLEPSAKARLARLLDSPYGMVLATRPTGSGKTTTLYAALGRLNDVSTKIVAIEDPVEYRVDGVNQIQVNPRIGLGFANVLRSILRQDPDVILVGEIRDEETARLAIQASLTGHLVLSTLHTNDAASAITRLLDMGVEPYLLTASLRAVVAQRLLRRLCEACKAPVEVAPADRGALDIEGTVQGPVGCPVCHGTGYQGRIVVTELLELSPEIRDAVARGEDAETLRRLHVAAGHQTLAGDARRALLAGETSLAEVLAAVGAPAVPSP